MRKVWLWVFLAAIVVTCIFTPVFADNLKSTTSDNVTKASDEDVIMIEGAVMENSPGNIDPHRRRSLSSRGGRIVETATKFIGTPYRWAGTTPAGFDCSGFVMRIFSLNGVPIRRMADEQYYGGNKITKNDLIVGDLVFFSTYGPGVTHVGIFIGNNQFIHSSSTRGVTINSLEDPYYRRRFIGGCRY